MELDLATGATRSTHQAASFYARPGLGAAGKKLTVKTNYFPLKSLPDGNIHHYDVSITPEKCPPRLNRQIFAQLLDIYGKTKFNNIRPVYDGRANAFARRELPFRAETFTVILPEDDGITNSKRPPREFKVKFRWANDINMAQLNEFLTGRTQINNNILTAIMAIDIIIRNDASNRFTSTGRAFYTPQDSRPLGGGAEVWAGFFQSARPAPGRMLINLDVSATAFYRDCYLTDFAVEVLQLRGKADLKNQLQDRQFKQLEKAMKNLRIQVVHRGEKKPKHKVSKLHKLPASQSGFEKDGKTITVAQYFQESYNMRDRKSVV